MPIDELEIHPYLDCHENLNKANDYFEGLIIGTFPIYDITQPLLNGPIRFGANAAFQFFYGSTKNKFWSTLCDIFEVPNEVHPLEAAPSLRAQLAKNVLTNNRLLITDVIKTTNRFNSTTGKAYCSLDSSLLNTNANAAITNEFRLNISIRCLLEENISIKYLYFTATGSDEHTPFGLFTTIFGNDLRIIQSYIVGGRLWAIELLIKTRKFIAFMLPSPAGNGYRGLQLGEQGQTLMFVNYIQRIDPIFYIEIRNIPPRFRSKAQKLRLTSLRDSFFKECWLQAFIHHNIFFEG